MRRLFLAVWRRITEVDGPISILAAPAPLPSPTGRLFVVRTDFPVNEGLAMHLEAMLAPIREKYGIDFIVLEPGITLSRFDDI